MQLKFKLTDRNTGADVDPHLGQGIDFNGRVCEADEAQRLCTVFMDHLIARLFTGLHDAAGNEIYEGDLLGSFDSLDILPLRVGYDFGRFQLFNADATSQCDLLDQHEYKLVIGNRWQPEFRGVFGND